MDASTKKKIKLLVAFCKRHNIVIQPDNHTLYVAGHPFVDVSDQGARLVDVHTRKKVIEVIK